MAQISTDQPYHENPQRDCITLDRTAPAPKEVMLRVAISASATYIGLG